MVMEKVFCAKVCMTTQFPVYNCRNQEEADNAANDIAIDFVQCTGLGRDIEIEWVEVTEQNG